MLLTDTVGPVPDQGALAFGFLNALRLIARDGAVAIAIDDVQWLDAPSAHLVQFAARRLRAEPVRFLLAVRSGGAGRERAALVQALPGRSQTLTVGALSLGALFELLRTALGQPPTRSLLRQLHEISGGNPLHALEIGRALERQGGRVEPGGALPVPDDLRARRRASGRAAAAGAGGASGRVGQLGPDAGVARGGDGRRERARCRGRGRCDRG